MGYVMAARIDRSVVEEALEPDLEIVDPHHHLWDRRALIAGLPAPTHPFEQILRISPRYLLDELITDLKSGHKVRQTVYVECGSQYRGEGPEVMRPVGETEFVVETAEECAGGSFGPIRACAGIVGHADLRLGVAVREVLEAHVEAGGGRFRGVRQSASWDADPQVLGPLARMGQGLYVSDAFRAGFAELQPLGLSFDAWLLEPQLPDLVDLAGRFPDTTIVLDHVGTPLGIGAYAARREDRFNAWRKSIAALAAHPNVVVKVGGLAMPFGGFAPLPPDSEEPLSAYLARQWSPYVDVCLDAFGMDRCMFESNFPVDLYTCRYGVLWNVFKRLADGFSAHEKAAVFSGVARRVYRLP